MVRKKWLNFPLKNCAALWERTFAWSNRNFQAKNQNSDSGSLVSPENENGFQPWKLSLDFPESSFIFGSRCLSRTVPPHQSFGRQLSSSIKSESKSQKNTLITLSFASGNVWFTHRAPTTDSSSLKIWMFMSKLEEVDPIAGIQLPVSLDSKLLNND